MVFRGGDGGVPLQIEEEVFDEDNMLKSKMTRDRRLSLQPSKRLKSHLLFREEPLE